MFEELKGQHVAIFSGTVIIYLGIIERKKTCLGEHMKGRLSIGPNFDLQDFLVAIGS